MNLRIPIVACLGFVPLAAQVPYTATWTADTELVVRAGMPSQVEDRDTIAPGTDLRPGVSLAARSSLDLGRGHLDATWTTPSDGSVRADLVERGWCHRYSFPWGGYVRGRVDIGRHSTRLRILPSRTTFGTVRVTYATERNRGDGIRGATIGVDVGGDGSVEFTADTGAHLSVSYPVPVPAGGLDVVTTTRLYTQGSSHAGSDPCEYRGRLTVEFLPAPDTTFVAFGAGHGLDAQGGYAFRGPVRDVLFDSTGPANAIGVELFGLRRIDLPIPGTACRLLTDPLVNLPIRYGAAGSVRIVHSVPWDLTFFFDVQLFALDPGSSDLLCSGGVEVATR